MKTFILFSMLTSFCFTMQTNTIINTNNNVINMTVPSDILGALTSSGTINSEKIGKIRVFDYHSFVAVDRLHAELALSHLQGKGIKGCKLKVRKFDLSQLESPGIHSSYLRGNARDP